MTIGSVTVVKDVLGILLINPHSPLAPSSHAYISPNPLLPCYNISMYHFAWTNPRDKQGYKSDVQGLQLVVPWENIPLIKICNWCHSLYRHNKYWVWISICKVNSSFLQQLLVTKCLICIPMVVPWKFVYKRKLLEVNCYAYTVQFKMCFLYNATCTID